MKVLLLYIKLENKHSNQADRTIYFFQKLFIYLNKIKYSTTNNSTILKSIS